MVYAHVWFTGPIVVPVKFHTVCEDEVSLGMRAWCLVPPWGEATPTSTTGRNELRLPQGLKIGIGQKVKDYGIARFGDGRLQHVQKDGKLLEVACLARQLFYV